MRDPFPLQWPAGWPRTPYHERTPSRFVIGMARALAELEEALRRLDAANAVITSDLPTRRNGKPYGEAADNGVAVWFVLDGQERVFACDRWKRASENLHAISLTIGALRGIDRWGVSSAVDRAMQGFRALPSGDESPWWKILGIQRDVLEEPLATLARAKRAHRLLVRQAHPDTSADPDTDLVMRLNCALDAARRELDPGDASVKEGNHA